MTLLVLIGALGQSGALGFLATEGEYWTGARSLPWWSLGVVGGAVAVWGVAGVIFLRETRLARKKRLERELLGNLQEQVRRIEAVFAETVALMDRLQYRLQAERAALEATADAAAEQRQLLDLNWEQAARIQYFITKEARVRELSQSRQSLLYFVTGVLVSIPVGIVINLLTN